MRTMIDSADPVRVPGVDAVLFWTRGDYRWNPSLVRAWGDIRYRLPADIWTPRVANPPTARECAWATIHYLDSSRVAAPLGTAVMLDLEGADVDEWPAAARSFAAEWCKVIGNAGYLPGLYSGIAQLTGPLAGIGEWQDLAFWSLPAGSKGTPDLARLTGPVRVLQYAGDVPSPEGAVDWNVVDDTLPLLDLHAPAKTAPAPAAAAPVKATAGPRSPRFAAVTSDGWWAVAVTEGGALTVTNAMSGGWEPPTGFPLHGDLAGKTLRHPIVGIALARNSDGYWMLDEGGGVYAFGAPYLGDTSTAKGVDTPAVGITATAEGYAILHEGGGVYSFDKTSKGGPTNG